METVQASGGTADANNIKQVEFVCCPGHDQIAKALQRRMMVTNRGWLQRMTLIMLNFACRKSWRILWLRWTNVILIWFDFETRRGKKDWVFIIENRHHIYPSGGMNHPGVGIADPQFLPHKYNLFIHIHHGFAISISPRHGDDSVFSAVTFTRPGMRTTLSQ